MQRKGDILVMPLKQQKSLCLLFDRVICKVSVSHPHNFGLI